MSGTPASHDLRSQFARNAKCKMQMLINERHLPVTICILNYAFCMTGERAVGGWLP